MEKLAEKVCKVCEGGVDPLTNDQVQPLLSQIPNWVLTGNGSMIEREFNFKNFLRTMSFVNAVAWIANQENHHPDMTIGYNHCLIRFQTHAIGGLSENDFICAAKINKLLDTE